MSNQLTEPASSQVMESLVSVQWLAEHLASPDLVVLDCSVLVEPNGTGGFNNFSGRANYEEAHIPSAGFADLMVDLSDPSAAIQYSVPSVGAFSRAMSDLGVGDGSRVVLYDSTMSVWAARVWWMLRWAGFDQAAVLDGGFKAWVADGHPVSSEAPVRNAAALTPQPRPHLIADKEEVLEAIDDGSTCLIDTLPTPHFEGSMAIYDRPGHIPGASSTPVSDLLTSSGTFKPADELAAMHPGDKAARTITYCGGGIAASANAFVMTRLGFTNVAVYTASLQEWAADASLPLEVGAA